MLTPATSDFQSMSQFSQSSPHTRLIASDLEGERKYLADVALLPTTGSGVFFRRGGWRLWLRGKIGLLEHLKRRRIRLVPVALLLICVVISSLRQSQIAGLIRLLLAFKYEVLHARVHADKAASRRWEDSALVWEQWMLVGVLRCERKPPSHIQLKPPGFALRTFRLLIEQVAVKSVLSMCGNQAVG